MIDDLVMSNGSGAGSNQDLELRQPYRGSFLHHSMENNELIWEGSSNVKPK